jgi:glycosyltransferase involved in cell wall biosynthesis
MKLARDADERGRMGTRLAARSGARMSRCPVTSTMTVAPDNGPVLHVAALPFPSPQGTQAVIAAMLEALQDAGRESHLLCYAHAGAEHGLSFPVHRASDFAGFRSLRSGPSPRKLIADAELAAALRRTLARVKPSVVVAHHVEAAMIASGCQRRVFFAHTGLGNELPTYGALAKGLFRSLIGRAGTTLDAALVKSAHAVAAVSPVLTSMLREHVPSDADKVRCVLPPWSMPGASEKQRSSWPAPPSSAPHRDARARARVELGLDDDALVWLYTGNLDAYQGWPELIRAVAIGQALMPNLVLLVATASDPAPLRREAERAGLLKRIIVRPLQGEDERAILHAAADAVAVPRTAPGGLPVKLLDALSRGVPCIVTPAACAGLPLEHCVALARRDDGEAMVAALLELMAAPERIEALTQAGPKYVQEHHHREAFLKSFDEVIALAHARS